MYIGQFKTLIFCLFTNVLEAGLNKKCENIYVSRMKTKSMRTISLLKIPTKALQNSINQVSRIQSNKIFLQT